MATATKYYISEQVLFRLAGGYFDKSFPIQPEDVWAALGDKVNSKFKTEHFNVTMANGETVPDGSMFAYYDGIAVTSLGNGRSKCTLPVTPVKLVRNMGVYEITDTNARIAFIPLLAGQEIMLRSQPLINDLMGQVGYTVKGTRIDFTKDIKLMGASTVNMTLVVMDISTYDITDPLPIPADMLDQIINELVEQFSLVLPESGIVNSFTTSGQNAKP